MKKTILTIILILVTSACTMNILNGSSDNVFFGGALEITRFEGTPSVVAGGKTIRLEMDVENLGDYTVPEDHAFVYITGSDMDLDEVEKTQYFSRDIKTEDPLKGIPAGKETFRWTFSAPELERGLTKTQTYIGKIYQNYETRATGNIWVYTDVEARAMETSGRSLNYPSFESGRGPLSIDFSVSPSPVIIYDDRMFAATIIIRKIGDGTVYQWGALALEIGHKDLDIEDLNEIYVDIKVDGLSFRDGCSGWYTIVPGRDTTLTCDVIVTKSIQTFDSFPIEASVKYGYITETSTSIVVEGK